MPEHPLNAPPALPGVQVSTDWHGTVSLDPPVLPVHAYIPARTVPVRDEQGRVVLSRQKPSRQSPPPLEPCLGLERAVLRELEDRRYPVWRQQRVTRIPGDVASGDGRDTRLADFVRSHSLGLVQIGAHVDRMALLADLVSLLPQTRFALATAGRQQARQLHTYLSRRCIASSWVQADRPPRQRPGRVVVGTFHALGHTEVECNKREVLVVVHAPDALHDAARLCLTQADFRCRLFGLLPGCRLSDGEQDRLAVIFGFDRLEVPATGWERVVPRVMPWKYEGGGLSPRDRAGQVALALARGGCRNRLVARLASKLNAGNVSEVSWLTTSCDQVIVLVETLAHARRLGTLLKGWPVLPHPGEKTQPSWRSGERWIATTTAASNIDLPQHSGCTAVVWAGATAGPPTWPGSWEMAPLGTGRQVLLVDVQDHHHPLLRKWNLAREHAYEQAGWLAPGRDATTQRIEEFLARRRNEA